MLCLVCTLYRFPFLNPADPARRRRLRLLPPLQTQMLCAVSSVDPPIALTDGAVTEWLSGEEDTTGFEIECRDTKTWAGALRKKLIYPKI